MAVEEGKSLDTTVDVVEGMQFDRGFLSPNFVTNVDDMETVLEKPLVFIYEDKLDAAKQIVPLLEKVMESKVNAKRMSNVFGRVGHASEEQRRNHQEKQVL